MLVERGAPLTEVSFHFNVADRTDYTCRLVRKATRAGASVVMTGPAAALAHFDRALWTFDDLEFLPHAMLKPGQQVAERLRDEANRQLSAPSERWILQVASMSAAKRTDAETLVRTLNAKGVAARLVVSGGKLLVGVGPVSQRDQHLAVAVRRVSGVEPRWMAVRR